MRSATTYASSATAGRGRCPAPHELRALDNPDAKRDAAEGHRVRGKVTRQIQRLCHLQCPKGCYSATSLRVLTHGPIAVALPARVRTPRVRPPDGVGGDTCAAFNSSCRSDATLPPSSWPAVCCAGATATLGPAHGSHPLGGKTARSRNRPRPVLTLAMSCPAWSRLRAKVLLLGFSLRQIIDEAMWGVPTRHPMPPVLSDLASITTNVAAGGSHMADDKPTGGIATMKVAPREFRGVTSAPAPLAPGTSSSRPAGSTASMKEVPRELRGVPSAPLRTAPGTIPNKPAGGTALMRVAPKEFRGVPSEPVRTATGTITRRKSLSELGRFVESQVQAYKMATEAAAREARTATALSATRDEMITDLRFRINDLGLQLATMKTERDVARAEAETLARQLRTVTQIAISPTGDAQNRRRWFGRS